MDRPEPFFVAECPALDFLNTIATPRREEIEWLGTGLDLLDWMVAAGLINAAEADPLRAEPNAEAMDRAACEARKLREAFRACIADVAGNPEAVAAHPMIDRLNTLLAEGTQSLRIAGAELVSRHRISTPADLLPRLAAECAACLCAPGMEYIRQCEGPTCTLWFRDTSKNHRRRWCSMEVCGNRAKAATYRRK